MRRSAPKKDTPTPANEKLAQFRTEMAKLYALQAETPKTKKPKEMQKRLKALEQQIAGQFVKIESLLTPDVVVAHAEAPVCLEDWQMLSNPSLCGIISRRYGRLLDPWVAQINYEGLTPGSVRGVKDSVIGTMSKLTFWLKLCSEQILSAPRDPNHVFQIGVFGAGFLNELLPILCIFEQIHRVKVRVIAIDKMPVYQATTLNLYRNFSDKLTYICCDASDPNAILAQMKAAGIEFNAFDWTIARHPDINAVIDSITAFMSGAGLKTHAFRDIFQKSIPALSGPNSHMLTSSGYTPCEGEDKKGLESAQVAKVLSETSATAAGEPTYELQKVVQAFGARIGLPAIPGETWYPDSFLRMVKCRGAFSRKPALVSEMKGEHGPAVPPVTESKSAMPARSTSTRTGVSLLTQMLLDEAKASQNSALPLAAVVVTEPAAPPSSLPIKTMESTAAQAPPSDSARLAL